MAIAKFSSSWNCCTCVTSKKIHLYLIQLTSQRSLWKAFDVIGKRFSNDISWWLFRSICMSDSFQFGTLHNQHRYQWYIENTQCIHKSTSISEYTRIHSIHRGHSRKALTNQQCLGLVCFCFCVYSHSFRLRDSCR